MITGDRKRCLSFLPGLLPPVSRVLILFFRYRGVSLAPLKRGGSTPSLLICHPPRRVLNSIYTSLRVVPRPGEASAIAFRLRLRLRRDKTPRQAAVTRRPPRGAAPRTLLICRPLSRAKHLAVEPTANGPANEGFGAAASLCQPVIFALQSCQLGRGHLSTSGFETGPENIRAVSIKRRGSQRLPLLFA